MWHAVTLEDKTLQLFALKSYCLLPTPEIGMMIDYLNTSIRVPPNTLAYKIL